MQVASILLGNGHTPRTDRRHNKTRTARRHDKDNSTDHVPVSVNTILEVYVRTLLVGCSSSLCWSTCMISRASLRLRARDKGTAVSELSDAVEATDTPLTSLVLERVVWVNCTRGAIPHKVFLAVCLVLAMLGKCLEPEIETRTI